jgi:hypothetical protein
MPCVGKNSIYFLSLGTRESSSHRPQDVSAETVTRQFALGRATTTTTSRRMEPPSSQYSLIITDLHTKEGHF